MSRPVTLFTGQFADLPLINLAAQAKSWGYDGLELACWGDHFNVGRGADDPAYCQQQKTLLEKHGLRLYAISNHLAGQMVLDPLDHRTDAWAPRELAGQPQAKREWAIAEMKRTARAARNLGVSIVVGFTGSPIWHMVYPFPPVSTADVTRGYAEFAETWGPILDHFQQQQVRFALEVHPGEIAFDLYSAEAALAAVGDHPAFGFNFDPSHLVWQGVDPLEFLYRFPDRIVHVHIKDVEVRLTGRTGLLASHLPFGDPRRGWDFRSPGRGKVDFKGIIRALNTIGYAGPLSVEWEDNSMERSFGAAEACRFVRGLDAPAPTVGSFEDAFKR
jgi:sugar phosphate isomerase/epimerase